MNRIATSVVVLIALVTGCNNDQVPPPAPAQSPRVLKVALFAYVPDAATAALRFKNQFQKEQADKKNGEIDLEVTLFDCYDDKLLDQIQAFDIVEVDLCRMTQLAGALDPLPARVLANADDFVEPAKSFVASEQHVYAAPHWLCGNFITAWGDNKPAAEAKSLKELLAVLKPEQGQALVADLYGGTTLGEIYADVFLQQQGASAARKHLAALGAPGATVGLDPAAEAEVLQLVRDLPPRLRAKVDYFHNHNYVYPRAFATTHTDTLLGYSERLYYVGRELEAQGDAAVLNPAAFTVHPFSFSAPGDGVQNSSGAVTWVDAFVVPKGKLAPKQKDIEELLLFSRSPSGYLPFIQPDPESTASYLLPAVKAEYDDPQVQKIEPTLAKYRAAIDATLPITQSDLWLGMKAAGKILKKEVKKLADGTAAP